MHPFSQARRIAHPHLAPFAFLPSLTPFAYFFRLLLSPTPFAYSFRLLLFAELRVSVVQIAWEERKLATHGKGGWQVAGASRSNPVSAFAPT
jgi:hypothetical protein